MSEKLVRSVVFYNKQYRVTIPKHVALMMGLEHKDKLEFLFDRGDIVLRKVK